MHHRLHAGLHDHVGLGRHEALLRKLLVGEERRHVEGVGPRLLVGEAELRLQERPVAGAPAGADQDRLALELLELVVADARMRDDDLRVLLEDRGDHQERQVLLGVIDALERVRHDHVDAPAEQELRGVLLRPAHAHVAVDAVLLVDAVGDARDRSRHARPARASWSGSSPCRASARTRARPAPRPARRRRPSGPAPCGGRCDISCHDHDPFPSAPQRAISQGIPSNRYAVAAGLRKQRRGSVMPKDTALGCPGKRQARNRPR